MVSPGRPFDSHRDPQLGVLAQGRGERAKRVEPRQQAAWHDASQPVRAVPGGVFCCLALVLILPQGAWAELNLKTRAAAGGLGDQSARGVAVTQDGPDTRVVFCGTDTALFGGQALLGRADGALGDTVLHPWPDASGSYDPAAEVFAAAAATAEGLYCAGHSWSQTTDEIGLKEPKAVLAKFSLDGATGPAAGGALWVARPLLFPTVQGAESFQALTVSGEEGGTVLYAAGHGDAGAQQTMALLARFGTDGALHWLVPLGDAALGASSRATGVVTMGGAVYVAGLVRGDSADPATSRAALWKVSPDGQAVWSRVLDVPLGGEFTVAAASDGFIYLAVGQEAGPAGGRDAIVAQYDEQGELRAMGIAGQPGDDVPHALAATAERLYVVGGTTSTGAGGEDVFVSEVDLHDGAILQTDFVGGVDDDRALALALRGDDLYVAGERRSATDSGNLSGQSDVLLLHYRLAEDPPFEVAIDVKPRNARNRLSLPRHGHGTVRVAVLSSAGFSALGEVDAATVTFGRTGLEPSLAGCSGTGRDVNDDGFMDLVCLFHKRLTGFQAGDTEGILQGRTSNGRAFVGRDAVHILLPPRPRDTAASRPVKPRR